MKPKSIKKYRSCALLLVFSLSLLFPCLLQAYCEVNNGIYNDINGTWITYNSNISASNYEYYSYTGIVDLSGITTANTIVHHAFYKCSITNVRIPNNIISIGGLAFGSCKKLKRILIESPSCVFEKIYSSSYPFEGTTCTLYVPEGSGDYYRSQASGGNLTIVDSFSAAGHSFSGSGSGTADDPYLIFNPIQLNQVRYFLDEKYVHFKLMSDIDITDWIADNNPSQGWQPIGTESSPFMGFFDGNNHKISGLRINRSSSDNVGLFGYLLWADVKNLSIDNSEIIGNKYVGILAGQAVSCDFDNCIVDGNISATDSYIGGIFGCGSGNISECYSNVSISGKDFVGGLVGSTFNGQGAETHFEDCTFNGFIYGNSNVAPCIGYSDHYLSVTNFRSMGNVTSDSYNVGGIIGSSCGGIMDINKSYSLCDIVCHGSNAGGIAGYVKTEDNGKNTTHSNIRNSIKNTYYNGCIRTDSTYTGGIIGYSDYIRIYNVNYGGVIVNCCYSYANVIGESFVGGIAGYTRGATITSNVSICGLISAITGNVGRIYGSDIITGVTLGENGTADENKGLATASVMLNGVQLELPDGLKHGTNVGSSTLKYKATYQGMGWDFDEWTIVETESYPYKPIQCAPPVITSILEARATEVYGNSIDGGTVRVITSDREYTAHTSDHQWNVQVDPLQAGSIVRVQADTEDKLPSYFELKTVGFGGSGTEEDPFSIYTAEDLQSINSYKYYRLMADIDLTEWINENNPTGGWIPIGASGNATMKQLDGNGHKITGLWCDNNLENCGLFATTYNATIRDLTIYIANGKKVKGGTNTGALIGYAEATELDSITVYGDVEGGSNVGGIVGYGNYDSNDQYFSLRKSSLYGDVTGDYFVGGLVGQSAGTLQECYSQGNVTGKGADCYVGGIVGYNRFRVENCYSNAAVNAGASSSNSQNQYAGGIVGNNSHTILHCYATGDIFAVRCAAGIAGYNTSTAASVYQCYAMNKRINVASSSGIAMRVIGGIRNGAPTPEANNYALKTMVVSVNNIPQTIYDDLLHGQSLTEGALRKEATYRDNGWDMDHVWSIIENETYPYLRSINSQGEQTDVVLGDVNGDSSVTISDVTALIDYLLSGNPDHVILESADINQDGNVSISDVTSLIDYLLMGH